jgi:dienelactone hydrolase
MPLEDGVTRHGPLNPRNPARVRDTFVILAPQLPRAGDHWQRFAESVAELVETALSQQGADPHRCYLSGFSFGGNGVFDLAATQPVRWAALWPVDPTRVPNIPLAAPVWLSIGQIARRLRGRFIQALALTPATPDGAGDRVYLDEGADHAGSARLAYADERIYDWLLHQRLPDSPS